MTNTDPVEFLNMEQSGKQFAFEGNHQESRAYADSWNSDENCTDFGPATVRYSPGRGWHVTVTRWA